MYLMSASSAASPSSPLLMPAAGSFGYRSVRKQQEQGSLCKQRFA